MQLISMHIMHVIVIVAKAKVGITHREKIWSQSWNMWYPLRHATEQKLTNRMTFRNEDVQRAIEDGAYGDYDTPRKVNTF